MDDNEPDLEVRAQTPETQEFLRVLVPPTEGRAPIPASAYNAAAQLLAVEAGSIGTHRWRGCISWRVFG